MTWDDKWLVLKCIKLKASWMKRVMLKCYNIDKLSWIIWTYYAHKCDTGIRNPFFAHPQSTTKELDKY